MVVAPGQQNRGQGGHQVWQRDHIRGHGGVAVPGHHQGMEPQKTHY